MSLNIPFIVLIILNIIFIAISLKARRKNWGFICLVSMIILINAINIPLYEFKKLPDIKIVISIFYILESLFYFFLLITIAKMRRQGKLTFFILASGIISLGKLGLIISNFFGSRLLSFRKHIFLGQNWWITENPKNLDPIFNFQTLQYLTFLVSGLTLIALIISTIKSSKIFRNKYLSFLIVSIFLTAIEILAYYFNLPIFIESMVMNIFSFVGIYFVHYYSDNKLKEWSLLNFANEMSDGFILYNEYDYPIHINDLLKNILSEDLIKSFTDKKILDSWLSQTIMVENIEVLPYERKDTHEDLYFKTKKNEIYEKGIYLGTIYTLHDTTETIHEIRVMENANFELERAAKMKSDFLANMSHEIRTPMNAVIGMAELAMREDLPDKVIDYLTQIQISGKNLLNIINDILDFSKIEAGKMEIIEDDYEPMSEINDIANILTTRIEGKNIELFVITDTSIPHKLHGDAMRIRQILINLANNAIKFTKNGFVCIKVSCQKISPEEINITYHVIDTGSGIKEEDIEKLFVSFQQVDSKRNRSVEGTGLGLAISQKLCQAMNGDVGVESTYGEGSDFYFTLPQKIVDPTCELLVEDAEAKNIFLLNNNPLMLDKFKEEMQNLNMQSQVLPDIDSYQASGKKDFIFFDEKYFSQKDHDFLESNPDVNGILLVAFDSSFSSPLKNLRIMKRPITTLNIVAALNNKNINTHVLDDNNNFTIDFQAPQAKILIVDDNSVNITIAIGLINPIKAQCFSAQSAKEAIAMLEKDDFDIVLMDHMMPEMDGIEATNYIRNNIASSEELPIIALTANVMEGVKDMFLKEGFNDFVAKPVDIKDLITSLKKYIPAEKIIASEEQIVNKDDDDEFFGYEGLNSQDAIKNLGSQKLYIDIVEDYCKTVKDKHDLIQSQYQNKDWENYTINVHALKSISRQIGAPELGDLAEKLEKAGKASDFDTIDKYNQKLLDDYEELVNNLKPYFETDTEENIELEDISLEDLSSLLENLSEACDELDMDTMEEIEKELKKYSYTEDIQKLMDDLYKAVENMDVDECIDIIDEIRQSF